jgi:hypothetical protein
MERTIAGRNESARKRILPLTLLVLVPQAFVMFSILGMAITMFRRVGVPWQLLSMPVLMLAVEAGMFAWLFLKVGTFEYRVDDFGIASGKWTRLDWSQVSSLAVFRPGMMRANQPFSIQLRGGETGIGTYAMQIVPSAIGLEATRAVGEELTRRIPLRLIDPAFVVLARLIARSAESTGTGTLPPAAQKALSALDLRAAWNALKQSPDAAPVLLAQLSYLLRKPAEARMLAEPFAARGDEDAKLVCALCALDTRDLPAAGSLLASLRDSRFTETAAAAEERLARGITATDPVKPRNSVVVQVAVYVMLAVWLAFEVSRLLPFRR